MKQEFTDLISDHIIDMSLKDRLSVLNQIGFIRLTSELGYRDEKAWGPDEEETLTQLTNCAVTHTNFVLEEIREYIDDKIDDKANEYAKFIHGEEYNDPVFERDVYETIKHFKAGFNSVVRKKMSDEKK